MSPTLNSTPKTQQTKSEVTEPGSASCQCAVRVVKRAVTSAEPCKLSAQEPVREAAACSHPESTGGAKAEVIYLGIDAHAQKQVVVVQVDATTPKPAQSMSFDGLLKFAAKQTREARRVVACYEAGPCGYTLCRELIALGVEAMVVRPKCWDTFGAKVKTDGRDARSLCEALERYDRGNEHALSVVRLPTVDQERARSITRQRDALVDNRKRISAQGRSAVLFARHHERLTGQWWAPRAWARWQKQFGSKLIELLAPLQIILIVIDDQIAELTEQIEQTARINAARQVLPKGVGELTQQIIGNEVCDWNRFSNRRQVSSFTGLCPTEHSSGGKRRQGSVNKHGNPLLRKQLCEAVWRLIKYQPDWIRLKKFTQSQPEAGRKKKLIAALARMLAVDLWRLNTGRTTLEALGLIAATPPTAATK